MMTDFVDAFEEVIALMESSCKETKDVASFVYRGIDLTRDHTTNVHRGNTAPTRMDFRQLKSGEYVNLPYILVSHTIGFADGEVSLVITTTEEHSYIPMEAIARIYEEVKRRGGEKTTTLTEFKLCLVCEDSYDMDDVIYMILERNCDVSYTGDISGPTIGGYYHYTGVITEIDDILSVGTI